MHRSPFVQPYLLMNAGSSFQCLMGIFQDGGVISRPSRLSKVTAMSKFPTLGTSGTIKIPTLGTDITVKIPWVARPPPPPPPRT